MKSGAGANQRALAGAPINADAYRQVKARLNEFAVRLAQDNQLRLPAEDVLGEMFGVSRATIRSALLSLQKEGKLLRFHGRGTFINKYAIRMTTNLSEDRRFLDLLAGQGFKATDRTLSINRVRLSEEIADKLELPSQSDAYAIERLFEADGNPAVFSVDYIPLSHLIDDREAIEPGRSTFDVLARNAGQHVLYSVAELIPTVPDVVVAELLKLPVGSATLLLRHVHVNDEQRPIAATDAHINGAFLRFSVVRRYIDS
ncbi:MAG: GntR family transcriptional regulator [Acidimicrobiales bacterium]